MTVSYEWNYHLNVIYCNSYIYTIYLTKESEDCNDMNWGIEKCALNYTSAVN